MNVIINGETHACEAKNLADLWAAEAPDPDATRGCAIALNGAVVRKEAWEKTPLSEGDRVEIVRAFAGG